MAQAAVGMRSDDTAAWSHLSAPLHDLWRQRIAPLHAALREGHAALPGIERLA